MGHDPQFENYCDLNIFVQGEEDVCIRTWILVPRLNISDRVKGVGHIKATLLLGDLQVGDSRLVYFTLAIACYFGDCSKVLEYLSVNEASGFIVLDLRSSLHPANVMPGKAATAKVIKNNVTMYRGFFGY